MKKRLLSTLLALCMVLALLPAAALAAEPTSGTCGDNVTWSLANGTLTISGTGKMTDYPADIFGITTAPWRDQRNTITAVIFSDGITRIGDGVFASCGSVTSVTIPDSVTSIGSQAFDGTPWLKSLGEFAVVNHILLKYQGDGSAVTIPNGITRVNDRAFYNNSNVTSVTIPGSVTTIGGRAFERCYSLKSVTIPTGVTSIGELAFSMCSSLTGVTIPDTVTTIGGHAFSYSGLTSVTIPNSVAAIEDCTFLQCSSLTSVTIPDSVITIGVKAFEDCGSLKSVTIPSSVITIGDGAFSGCNSLTSVKIPDGVTTIGMNAFGLCYSLKSVTIPASVTTIGGNAFLGDAFGKVPWLTSLGEFAVVNGMLLAYQGNGGAVTIPNGITRINDDAFWEFYYWDYYENRNVTSVTIPDSVTSIGKRAFAYCRDLTSVTIPASVTSIEWGAFNDCDSLADIYYGGSESQWAKIDIDYTPLEYPDVTTSSNDVLRTATIHYGKADTPDTPPAPSFKIELSAQKLTVDAKENVACEKYNIDGNNYFKLRDLAELLSGTGSQFEVGYDDASKTISITTGKAYTHVGGELEIRGDMSSKAEVSAQSLQIDGETYDSLKVYNIGGNNFFQLRQLGEVLGFDVDYDPAGTGTAIVRSK